jgi:hypothetical protein
MAKALTFLQKLGLFRPKETDGASAFDLRLQRMGGVQKVNVARAVLFRSGLSH